MILTCCICLFQSGDDEASILRIKAMQEEDDHIAKSRKALLDSDSSLGQASDLSDDDGTC